MGFSSMLFEVAAQETSWEFRAAAADCWAHYVLVLLKDKIFDCDVFNSS